MKVKILIFMLVSIVICSSITSAGDLTGKDILNKAEENMDFGSYQAQAQMIIETTAGDQRTLKMKIWGTGTEKMIMKYTAPARIDGITFLFLNNEIWTYFPRTGRTRHLASHRENQQMMGSSFSFSDFSNEAYNDYSARLLRKEKFQGEKCSVIEGKAENKDATYDKIEIWVTENNFKLLQANYYNDGNKVKEMTVKSFQKINGKPRASKFIMKDLVNNNQTTFEYTNIKTGVKFKPDFFHSRNLQRISQR